MTAPGALPPRRSVYESPAVAPQDMTEAQQSQYVTAQIAGIVAAAGLSKKAVADQVTLLLVPMLRSLDVYSDAAVAAFGELAAQLVDVGRTEVAKLSWSSISSQLLAHGVQTSNDDFVMPTQGRGTPLAVAYRRVAADYRRRMAAGVESIKGLIAQAEEERFQQLGGAQVAQERTGESNAKIEGQDRSLGKSGGAKSQAGERSSGSSSKGSGAASKAGGEAQPDRAPAPPRDRAVNAGPDDWDAMADAERVAREAEDAAADAAFEAEQELRRQAALSEEQKQELLERAAQHEMEMRAERMVNDDIAMASRAASQDAMKAAPAGRITGYRRVLHPELTESGQSCGLCIAASTRVYKVGELLPIHNFCKCECVPIVNGNDPGSQINDEDLAALYDEAGGSTAKEDLANEKYVVFQHPELGPVLRNAKHSLGPIGFSEREASEQHKLDAKERDRAYYEKRADSFGTSK